MVEEKTSKKKQLILMVVGLAFMLVLVIGATYAYFQFTSQNDFKDPATIESSMGELGAGVTLTKAEDSTLTLNLSAADMLLENAQTYYASGSETPKTIATVKVAGSGYYNCTYTLEVTKTATSTDSDMYERFQNGYTNKREGQIFFTINDQVYDFNTANLFDANGKLTYTGTIETISSAEDINLTANMVIVNSETLDQTYLNGTDVSISINATEFNCTLIDDKPIVTNLAYAGVGIDSLGVKVETTDLYGIESYTFSIDGGDEITQTENTYTFTDLSLNTEYEITTYVTNTEGYKSEEVTQTFKTLSTDNLANAITTLDGLGEVDNVSPVVVRDYTNATIVTDANYEIYLHQSNSNTPIDNAFTYSNGTYTSVPENLENDGYYIVKITIPSDGYYQICYSIPPSTEDPSARSKRGYIYFEKNGTTQLNDHGTLTRAQNGCVDIGYVKAEEYLEGAFHFIESLTSISFYLQRSAETKEIHPGYRYQGATPSNYITFNGETWRIIGAVSGREIGNTEESYYTKIIRKEALKDIAYSTNGLSDWPSSDLYNALNGDYYNRINDYAETGLTDVSKDLIVDANWYHSTYYTNGTASEHYFNERFDSGQVTTAYVGLMGPSDYGYAAVSAECSSLLLNGLGTCRSKDWLNQKKSNYLLIPSNSENRVWRINAIGNVLAGQMTSSINAYPTVYLDTDIIITGGNGSESSPYTIAKPTS